MCKNEIYKKFISKRYINTKGKDTLQVFKLQEPSVRFGHNAESPNIRNGITSFGSYEDQPKHVALIPICTDTMREHMASLIHRLQTGKYKYKGAERTFKVRFSYAGIVTVPSSGEVLNECQRLLREHPDWVGDESLNRLFLVHISEENYTRDDEKSPYYRVKRLLLESGIALFAEKGRRSLETCLGGNSERHRSPPSA